MELYSLLPGESIELRAIAAESERRIQKFVGSWPELYEMAAQLDMDYDVYFGVAPRVADANGQLRGGNRNVRRIPVAWLDADAKGEHSIDTRLSQLQPWNPTTIVHSGGGLHCVPLDTQILTRRGWLSWSQVRVGDETLGLDRETKTLHWTAIAALVREQQPVWTIENKRALLRATSGHRWVSSWSRGHQRRECIEWDFVETKDISRRNHQLHLAAPLIGSGDIKTADAWLLGWILTDGSWSKDIKLSQSEKKYVREIDAGLARWDIPHSRGYDHGPNSDMVTWRFPRQWSRDWLSRLGMSSWSEASLAVLRMGDEARGSFLSAAFLGDGTFNYGTAVFTQNPGPKADALRLALFLDGYFPTTSSCDDRRVETIRAGNASVSWNLSVHEGDVEEVWCPVTESGTWVMRQGNTIALTGNCYWKLAEDADPRRAQRWMKGLAKQLDCDDTSDPARILRVPGTVNHKHDPLRFVDVIQNGGPAHFLTDLESKITVVLDDEPVTTAVDHARRIELLERFGLPKGGGEIEGEVFEGRDAAIFEAACHYRDKNYEKDAVMLFCERLNGGFSPPLTKPELERKVHSAFTREAPPLITEIVEVAAAVTAPLVSAPRTQIMSVAEVLSFEEPPIEFLAQGMFARSSIEFIAHPPKSGKTTVAINWGLRMAGCAPGAGLLDLKEKRRVLFWQPNADMSPRRTREWIRKVMGGLGLGNDICFDFWFDDGNSQIGENVKALEERCGDYDIIMIDSLNRFLPGVDEADTRVVAESFNVVRRLRTAYPEVCWQYIVQVGKNSSQYLGTQNPSFALRGNSAIAEAYDTLIQLATPKNTERDSVRGLSINRHIMFHGRDSDAYRGPFRTRYNLDTHVLEWETDLTPDEALGQIDDTDRQSRQGQRDAAVELLKIIFNDAEEETGERKALASEIYEIGDAHGINKMTMSRALSAIGGSKTGSGRKTEWVDFVIEVEE